MYKFCVFAGTTEGRRLVELLSRQPVKVTACVATEYGETLIEPSENVEISAQRLSENEMKAMMEREHFDLVVDATHPYAAVVTETICGACAHTETEYLRLLREGSQVDGDAVYVNSVEEAVNHLNATGERILLTTGSKELFKWKALRGFEERVYARVLPMTDSLQACTAAGLKPAHIIAMQGPFTEEINAALLRQYSARWLVTKDGGTPGGFEEKVSAVRRAGAKLLVIGRPPQKEGMSFPQVVELFCDRFGCKLQADVAVVGIGPGSRSAMTREAAEALEQSQCIIGAARMVQAAARPGQKVVEAIAPAKIAEAIFSHSEYQRFAVVMSGDTGFFSGTKKLLPLLEDCGVTVLPGISSLSYLCARLNTSYEDVTVASLHGREGNICALVKAHPRLFVLVGGHNGAGELCKELCGGGLGHVSVAIGQRLSYPEETIARGTAQSLQSGEYDSLSAVLIEHEPEWPVVTHGLADERFLRGEGPEGLVPMTKSEVRSVCLSKLGLTERSVCWDVGAGTGSVAIEMALQARRGQVFAIEKKSGALELLEKNRQRFGADNMTIVSGAAPRVCEDLPAPTHAFIGGSSGNMKEIIGLLLEKNPKVRIVTSAIALESVAELVQCMKAFPFTETEVVSLSVAKSRTAGSYHLMTGQNPIYLFTMQAGGAIQ